MKNKFKPNNAPISWKVAISQYYGRGDIYTVLRNGVEVGPYTDKASAEAAKIRKIQEEQRRKPNVKRQKSK